jgi:cob(I)alamin adenosyltransferase
MAILKKGLVQVYTGDGKGKTTAALGLAWRMLGAGGKVYICQFLKRGDIVTGESRFIEKLPEGIVLEQLEAKWDMQHSFDSAEQLARVKEAISQKLKYIQQIAQEGNYDLMILDEIVYCLSKKLARWEDVLAIIDGRDKGVELVLTGRGADERLQACADLVTEMREIKHPYQQGIACRCGIEF